MIAAAAVAAAAAADYEEEEDGGGDDDESDENADYEKKLELQSALRKSKTRNEILKLRMRRKKEGEEQRQPAEAG